MKQLIPIDNYNEYKMRQWKEVDRLYELKLFSKHIEIISEFHLSEEEKKFLSGETLKILEKSDDTFSTIVKEVGNVIKASSNKGDG